MKRLRDLEIQTGQPKSIWNGYKLMSRHVTDAVIHCDRTFPANVHGTVEGKPREHCQIFHDMGEKSKGPGGIDLVPGPLSVGTEDMAEVPRDISAPTARVFVHQHPYTGNHNHYEPTLDDQLIAREFPNLDHIVQTPASHRFGANPYIIYNGAVPPRFYTLVENPFGLPVPPSSPDRDELPPVHPYPSTR